MSQLRTFAARYEGRCRVCNLTFVRGELIARDAKGYGCPKCLGARLGGTTAGLTSRGVNKRSHKTSEWKIGGRKRP